MIPVMKRFHVSMLLVGLMLLASCTENKDSDAGSEIRLSAGTPTDYTIYADETSGTPAGGISFTTMGPWRATVSDTRAASWVTITPDHGDAAGDYTITVTLGVNTTGEDRSATVTIECGSACIVITIEQRGTTASGEVPDEGEGGATSGRWLVSKVNFYYDETPGVDDSQTEFTYDDQNRLIRCRKTSYDMLPGDQMLPIVATVEYTYGDGTVQIVNSESGTRYTAHLNAAGYADRVERIRKDGETLEITYTYDAANHLIRTETDEEWVEHVWKDGNLVENRNGTVGASDVSVTSFGYTDLENLESIDIVGAQEEVLAWYEELAWGNLLGVGSRNLLASIRGEGEWAYKDDCDLEYEVDSDGSVQRIIEYSLTIDGTRDNSYTYDIEHIQGGKQE